MAAFEPACLAASLGGLPLTDPRAACGLMERCFPALPAWPQLPRLSLRENPYVQFSEGLPGAVIAGDSIRIDRRNVDAGLDRLYLAYLGDDPSPVGSISRSYAEGLAIMLSMQLDPRPVAIKGQVIGPVSLGLQVVDQSRRPILYDEVLADAAAKLLRLKAGWQEQQLRRLHPQTIIFVDEPHLSSLGTLYGRVEREQVLGRLQEVLEGIQGLKGLFCCGETDWSSLLGMSLDIIGFDAYRHAGAFAQHGASVREFVRKGGVIAWGIVPDEGDLLALENVQSLAARLLEAMDLLADQGLARDRLLNQALITTACGLESLSVTQAIQACELTAALAAWMQKLLH